MRDNDVVYRMRFVDSVGIRVANQINTNEEDSIELRFTGDLPQVEKALVALEAEIAGARHDLGLLRAPR